MYLPSLIYYPPSACYTSPMIILDIETTGSDYAKHSIVQIAAIEFEHPENRYAASCRIWDGAVIDPFTRTYNGWTDEVLHDKALPTDRDIAAGFIAWAGSVAEKTIVGENPSFDRDFLRWTLERYGMQWSLGFRTLDIHTISTLHRWQRGIEVPHEQGMSMLRLDETLKYVGLPEEPKPHAALAGALREAEAFSRLIYGKPLLPEFTAHPLPKHCR